MTLPSTRVAGPAEASRVAITHVETVELERFPPSTTILGTYEVETDEHGNVLSLRSFRRYAGGEKP